jgi:hypothetical protein
MFVAVNVEMSYLLLEVTNVAAVQRQLGHKNASYSLQYSRITDDELNEVLDRRFALRVPNAETSAAMAEADEIARQRTINRKGH